MIPPREEDEESALTTLDADIDPTTIPSTLDLSQYCISSDADTEKMESDIINEDELNPQLSSILAVKRPSESSEESPAKMIKLAPPKEELKEEEPQKEELKEEEPPKEIAVEEELKVEEPVKEPVDKPVEETVEEPVKEMEKDVKEEPLKEEVSPQGMKIEQTQADEEGEAGDEEASADEEDEEEVENKGPSPMDLENQRLEAMDDITAIEYKFAKLRQGLYENKLMKLQLELQMCLEGSHQSLHTYYEKIAAIRDYKLQRAYQRQRYELACIDKETRATRTMIHQDFIKQATDLKRNLLTETTRQWYDINKERREMDNMATTAQPHYHVPVKTAGKTLSCITGYAGAAAQLLPGEPVSEDRDCENIHWQYRHNPVDKLEVIVDRMRLNHALSDLQGLKQFYGGFPGAPALNGLRDSEIAEDVELLQRALFRD